MNHETQINERKRQGPAEAAIDDREWACLYDFARIWLVKSLVWFSRHPAGPASLVVSQGKYFHKRRGESEGIQATTELEALSASAAKAFQHLVAMPHTPHHHAAQIALSMLVLSHELSVRAGRPPSALHEEACWMMRLKWEAPRPGGTH